MKDLVSLIIPCYNYQNIIKKAVQSALLQTYTNIEIIVVDDGSTDVVTIAALEEIEQSNVTVVRQQNRGLAAARNTGVKNSKGSFLFFLDNDDTIHPYTIEILLRALKANSGVGYVYSEIYYYGNIPDFFVWKPQSFNAYNLIWANHPTLSCLITREAHEKVGGFSENFIHGWEDWEYWLKLSKHGIYGQLIEVPLYYYWRHGKTMAHTAEENKKYSIDALLNNNPEVYNPRYISSTKRKWRPIVTIIIFDSPDLQEVLESVKEQSIFDKQVIVLASEKNRIAQIAKATDVEISTYNYTYEKDLHIQVNRAFVEALGEFVFLLMAGRFLSRISLEQALWQKIFSGKVPFFYFSTDKSFQQDNYPIIPDEINRVSGILIETALLKFSGGIEKHLGSQEAIQDVLLRLLAANIPGSYVPQILTPLPHDIITPDASYIKFPQLYGLSPDVSPLNFPPLAELTQDKLFLGQDLGEKKDEILSDLSFPHYSEFRDQRLNFPSPINPAKTDKVVLYLIPYMVQGGAEKVDLDILDGLKKDGFEIIVVSEKHAEHKWKDRFANYSDEIFELSVITSHYDQKIKFLEYLTISRNISVIFIRSSSIGYHFVKVLNPDLKKEIKIVDLLHAYNRFSEDWIDFSTPYDQYIDERIAITEDLKEYLISKSRISKNKINVFHNAIDTKLYINRAHTGKLRNKLRLTRNIKIIGFIGRMVDDKDPLKWIDVAGELNKKTKDLHFVIAGDGELEQAVLKRIKELGIENITLLGWQNNIQEILPDFDILLMTSKNEGFPIVIMEALCSGVQVVAPDIGGIKEILKVGFNELTKPDAPAYEYAAKVMTLINLPEEEKSMLRNETINLLITKFDISVCQKNYVAKLNELVNSIDHKRKQDDAIKFFLGKEFINEDYRASQLIISSGNLCSYYLLTQSISQNVSESLLAGNLKQRPSNTSTVTTTRDEEIAKWYFNQYEVLPMWYKRGGHLVKVLYARRSFKSLFNDKAKGYDNSIGIQQWYDREYESLPLWYKRFGHVIKVFQGRKSLKSLFK